jgi:conjugal transfer pilus assembly protein TraB
VNYKELVDRWKSLPHKTRKNVRLAVAVGSLGLVSALIVHATRSNLNTANGGKDNTSSTVLLAPAANLNSQNLAATVEALSKQVGALRQNMTENNGMTERQIASYLQAHPIKPASDAQSSGADNAQLQALQAQIQALQAQVQARPPVQVPQAPQMPAAGQGAYPAASQLSGQAPSIYEVGSGQVSQAGAGSGAQETPSQGGAGIPPAPQTPQGGDVQTSGILNGHGPGGLPSAEHAKEQTEAAKNGQLPNRQKMTVTVSDSNQVYLPAGTILTGVSLNGVNVGTGPTAESNPQIVEMRVKKTAILPNGYRVNLTNCMIINTGFGNLAARRVYLRPTTLSCVDDQGRVIEAAVKGTVVGADGIAGIKGVVVDHQGSLIAKGFMAGLFSGLGGAFSPTSVTPLQINPGSTTQYQYPSGQQVMGSAIAGGVNNAGSMIAKLYIDEAKALQPTLQINPGVTADIILEQGAYVKKKGMTKAELQKTDYEASAAGSPAPTQQQQAQAQAQATLGGEARSAQAPAAQ